MMKFLPMVMLLLLGMVGCSESEESKQVKALQSDEALALNIEVLENNSSKEIKVQIKEEDLAQSRSYYLDYNVKHPRGETTEQRNSVDAQMRVRSPREVLPVSASNPKLSKNFIIKCSACHSDYANGIIGPSLMDKDADAIFESIKSFKNGTRSNVLMRDLIKPMKDKEIRDLAEEIYAMRQKLKAFR